MHISALYQKLKSIQPYTPRPKCQVPVLFGDGQCTDENNVKECEYDGGDCCIRRKSHEEMMLIYRFCTGKCMILWIR